MKRGWCFLLLWLLTPAWALAAELTGVRSRADAGNVRLVLDLSAPVKYKIFSLKNPYRLVVDIESTHTSKALSMPTTGMVKSVRAGKQQGGDLRVVFDLSSQVTPTSFLLKPQGVAGDRLVLDLGASTTPVKATTRSAGHQPQSKPKPQRSVVTRSVRDQPQRSVVIVIDPGHGGVDPGARGKNGVREKDVVLGISKELARLINKQPGMRAVLTRSDDRFIELSARRRMATKQHADLFLSIHANSFTSSKVRGSAVYALSQKGASSAAARALADKENAADLLGGVDLRGKPDLIKSVLMDLSQNATQESSLALAEKVLNGLSGVNKIHRNHVQTAGFVVLKSTSVPSVLVETAFISNPGEEKVLGSKKGQRKLASAIFKGVQDFVELDMALRLANAPSRPEISYEVRPGDTLSQVAQRYQVSLSRLRSVNSLRGDRLLVGKKLRIPTVAGI